MTTEVHQQTSSTFHVEVAGAALPEDVAVLMSYAVVEDNLNLPDMFLLSFLDPGRIVLGKSGFVMAAPVKISVRSEVNTGGVVIFNGEVTAIEVEFEGGRTRTVVRGFDKANRLYRGRRTRAFKDVKFDDIVKEVAKGAGLAVGKVDNPPGRPRPHVAQANLTDAEFLASLAGQVGFVLLVEDGKVNFHAPPASAEAPSGGDLTTAGPLQLVQGDNLLRFNATITADSQVKEVTVRGWEIAEKRAVVGTAPAQTSTSVIGRSPKELAADFGDHTFTAIDVPYGETTEVETAAKALAEQIAGTHAVLEGVARGNPALKAGTAVSLGLVGPPLEGKYTLTVTRHVFDNGEYLTHFSSTGRQERSLQSLASGGGTSSTVSPAFVTAPIPGVVSAIVTNVKDDLKQGRVKVKIPRLDDNFETDWLRVVQPGAGAGRGGLILPEVEDEVLVAFEHGDMRRGYVFGGLYNGKDKPSPAVVDGAVGSDGKVASRSFTSRKGHFLIVSDKDGDEHLELATKDSKFSLKLAKDADGGVVLLTSENLVTISAKGDIAITGKGKVTVQATGDLELKGQRVMIDGQSEVSLKGPNVKVAGSAKLDLDGGQMANLHASMVKIN